MYGIFVRYVQPCHTARVSTVLYISYEKLLVTVLELYTKFEIYFTDLSKLEFQ